MNIENLKLITLDSASIGNADDPSYPYKLEANLSPPELMTVTFIMLHGGTDRLVVRGMTKDAIEEFIAFNDLTKHPRLRCLTITGPDGYREEVKR